jgi:tetratricopeptide (TPR) repeat protein
MKLDFEFKQGDKTLLSKLGWETNLADPEITLTMGKVIASMKREERARVEVKHTYVPQEDKELIAILGDGYDQSKPIFAFACLHRLIKIEDWFKDGTTMVRTLRKGKGRSPFIDSTVKFRLQVQVNGKEIISNYPEFAPNLLPEETKEQLPYDYGESENLRSLSTEQKKAYLETANLWSLRLDSYALPSLMIKVLKSMKKNGVCEVKTTRVAKMKSNFANEELGLDQHSQFSEGDEILFRFSLLDCNYPGYFYKLTVQEKLAHILGLKATATKFFKAGNFKKAAAIYQKINGYYNFGDSTNNYAKEDAESEDFIRDNTALQAIKLATFNNLVVCKHKMLEWQSVIGITDQILSESMDPNNTKALYFRAQAFLKVEEFDQSAECLNKLLSLDSGHAEAKQLLTKVKKIRQEYRDKEGKKFAKLF